MKSASPRLDLREGDCIEQMRAMPDASVDSIVTDPPYHLTNNGGGPSGKGKETPFTRAKAGASSTGFMGMTWDGGDIAQSVEMWSAALRVLKPGGHLLAFSASRTYHRMVVAIEDAGFEIRDQIMWLYGSGFPKSRNLDGEWEGWGTALKPAHEPIVVARKPLIGTVVANVLRHGTGALNIDGCRIEPTGESRSRAAELADERATAGNTSIAATAGAFRGGDPSGRWPANLIHDGSDEVLAAFPDAVGQQGDLTGQSAGRKSKGIFGDMPAARDAIARTDVSTNAARFFYCAKADREDRHEGLPVPGPQLAHGSTLRDAENLGATRKGNHHPTVKPTELMRYLCRLVTPPGGLVLDPFMGSGSTGKAALLEGFRFIGIELSPEYLAIARTRIDFAARQGHQPSLLEGAAA